MWIAWRSFLDVESENQGRERVLAAAVLGARGNLDTLGELIGVSASTGATFLVAGRLEPSDWARVLTDELGAPD